MIRLVGSAVWSVPLSCSAVRSAQQTLQTGRATGGAGGPLFGHTAITWGKMAEIDTATRRPGMRRFLSPRDVATLPFWIVSEPDATVSAATGVVREEPALVREHFVAVHAVVRHVSAGFVDVSDQRIAVEFLEAFAIPRLDGLTDLHQRVMIEVSLPQERRSSLSLQPPGPRRSAKPSARGIRKPGSRLIIQNQVPFVAVGLLSRHLAVPHGRVTRVSVQTGPSGSETTRFDGSARPSSR